MASLESQHDDFVVPTLVPTMTVTENSRFAVIDKAKAPKFN